MKNFLIKNAFALTLSVALFSCVPQAKFQTEQDKRKTCETDLAATKKSLMDNENILSELKSKYNEIEKQLLGLQKDTGIIGTSYRNLIQKYDKLNQVNEQLLTQLSKLTQNTSNENSSLIGKLNMTQEELQKRQDELKKLQSELEVKKQSLVELTSELDKRGAKIEELEDVLKKKEQAIKELKKKVSDALVGFEGNGLTVTQKNGKIYVSMDESLLFASGSTKVEVKGVEALRKLGKVLEANADINVMVEGHTDDQPMNGNGEIKDNWDLSVMRATSVTKIILKGTTIDPKRISASGRGEFFPLDTEKTALARKKNRRTEIILTPRLDELLKVLETN